jgi:hypothetical protein
MSETSYEVGFGAVVVVVVGTIEVVVDSTVLDGGSALDSGELPHPEIAIGASRATAAIRLFQTTFEFYPPSISRVGRLRTWPVPLGCPESF